MYRAQGSVTWPPVKNECSRTPVAVGRAKELPPSGAEGEGMQPWRAHFEGVGPLRSPLHQHLSSVIRLQPLKWSSPVPPPHKTANPGENNRGIRITNTKDQGGSSINIRTEIKLEKRHTTNGLWGLAFFAVHRLPFKEKIKP